MTRIALAALAALALAATRPAAAADTPQQVVGRTIDRLRAALTKYDKERGPARKKALDEGRAAVNALLDFDAFAKGTLGKRWEELKEPERKRYVASLKGMMEASYLHSMKKSAVNASGIQTKFLGEEPQGDKILVKTRVDSGKDAAEVGYLLVKAGAGYRAVDISPEGVSLAETYRDMVRRLWPKKGLDGIVSAFDKKKRDLEGKLEELSDEKTAPAKK